MTEIVQCALQTPSFVSANIVIYLFIFLDEETESQRQGTLPKITGKASHGSISLKLRFFTWPLSIRLNHCEGCLTAIVPNEKVIQGVTLTRNEAITAAYTLC